MYGYKGAQRVNKGYNMMGSRTPHVRLMPDEVEVLGPIEVIVNWLLVW